MISRVIGPLVLLALTVPGSAVPSSASSGCAVQVPVVGLACPVAGGYALDLGDGSSLFTHGPDVAPSHATGATPPAPKDVSCVANESYEPHGLAIYFRTTDAPDLYATRAPDIQAQIEVATGMMVEEAAPFGVDLRFRMACAGSRPRIVPFVGTTPRATTTFSTIIADLRTAGFADTHQKYWIWVEGPRGLGGAAGIGTIRGGDSNFPSNGNNQGVSYSATFGFSNAEGGWSIMLHEASHNLGAVQNSALFSSGGFHCNDGRDVMCYADGGSKSSYTTTRCPVTLRYDCGNDDYFNPRPAPGSYLDRKWNLASPVDRFVVGCAYGVSRLLPLGSLELDVAACAGAPFSAAGFLPPRDLLVSPADVPELILLDVDVCFYAGATVISCAQTLNQPERGVVPAGATRAVVTLGAAPAADAVFSAI